MLGALGRQGPRRHQSREVALDVEQVDGPSRASPLLGQRIAVGEAAQAQRLVVALVGAPEAAAGLEHANALLLPREVGAQHVEESAGKRRSHHVEMGRDRILHGDRRGSSRRARETASTPTRSSRS